VLMPCSRSTCYVAMPRSHTARRVQPSLQHTHLAPVDLILSIRIIRRRRLLSLVLALLFTLEGTPTSRPLQCRQTAAHIGIVLSVLRALLPCMLRCSWDRQSLQALLGRTRYA